MTCLFCLMPNKLEESYSSVFNLIKATAETAGIDTDWRGHLFMTDFEQALRLYSCTEIH